MATIASFTHTIKAEDSIQELKQEIVNKRSNFFSFEFKIPVNNPGDPKFSVDDFWKLTKLTATKVSLFSNDVSSCEITDRAPMGFIRELIMRGTLKDKEGNPVDLHIKERVIIDEKEKAMLFFQLSTSGKILIFGINQVTKENDNVFFSGHYVYNILKDSKSPQDQAIMALTEKHAVSRIISMVEKMKEVAQSGKLNELYQKYMSE